MLGRCWSGMSTCLTLCCLLAFASIDACNSFSMPDFDEIHLKSYVSEPHQIKDYDFISPRINHQGRYRRSSDHQYATQVEFQAFGEPYHLDLVRSLPFYRRSIEVEYIHANNSVTRSPPNVEDCFYHGDVVSHNTSQVGVSICNGEIRGVIFHGEDAVFIAPMTKEHVDEYSQRHRRAADVTHIIYKRSEDDMHLFDTEPFEQHDIMTRQEGAAPYSGEEDIYVPPKYLEMCLFIDKDFVTLHGDKYEVFALTIMNAINRLFSVPSLGISLRIYIVRMIVLESDTPEIDGSSLNVTNPDAVAYWLVSLEKWSEEVNPTADTDPIHWDNIFMLTGRFIASPKNHRLAGRALSLAGTCNNGQGISLANGRSLSFITTGAHEISHTLTLRHDSTYGCGGEGYIMSGGDGSLGWSECSRLNLKIYLSGGASQCLNDVPDDMHSPLTTMALVGDTVSADDQCKLLGFNKTCDREQFGFDCRRSLCVSSDVNSGCGRHVALGMADGTPCGASKICLEGRCLAKSAIPAPVAGGWSDWTVTTCSRTCNGGVTIRQRACSNPAPIYGGAPCVGHAREVRLCNINVACPTSPDEYRNEQCQATQDQPDYSGRTSGFSNHSLLEHHNIINSCRNPCRRDGSSSFEYRPPYINADGTECWNYDIANAHQYFRCVAGACSRFGCDGVESSDREYDVCHICNGDGSSCSIRNGTFTSGKAGVFNAVHTIPAGATSVTIRNKGVWYDGHVAIRGASSGTDYFRGVDDRPSFRERAASGSFEIVHTISNSESFWAYGPTPEAMEISMYQSYSRFRARPKPTYEYYVANTGVSRFWDIGVYGPCSVSCGDGTKSRKVDCIRVRNGKARVVAKSLCKRNVGPKPGTTRSCNAGACQ